MQLHSKMHSMHSTRSLINIMLKKTLYQILRNTSFVFMLKITRELELNMLTELNKSGKLELTNLQLHRFYKVKKNGLPQKLQLLKQNAINPLLLQYLSSS